MEQQLTQLGKEDTYIRRFLESPVYIMVLRDTIDTAASSYKVSNLLPKLHGSI